MPKFKKNPDGMNPSGFKMKLGNKPSPKKFFGAVSFLGKRGSGRGTGTGSGWSNITAPIGSSIRPTSSSISAGTTALSGGLGSLAAGSQRSRSRTRSTTRSRSRGRGRGFFGGLFR
jgi:hypothetical protein